MMNISNEAAVESARSISRLAPKTGAGDKPASPCGERISKPRSRARAHACNRRRQSSPNAVARREAHHRSLFENGAGEVRLLRAE